MSALALAMAGVLLVASPTTAKGTSNTVSDKQTDAVWLAAHGGFLLGNARRCGIPDERVVEAGQLVQNLIIAASRDDKDAENASTRFAEFFIASTAEDKEAKLVASCKTVASEFGKLEKHQREIAKTTTVPAPAVGGTPSPNFRLSDGE